MIIGRKVPPGAVGVAPGTTTFELGCAVDDDVQAGPGRDWRQNEWLNPPRSYGCKGGAPSPAPMVVARGPAPVMPYATEAELKASALGLVLTPYGAMRPSPAEIVRQLPNGRRTSGPPDPQYNTQGEAGMYYDTPLGSIPTDAELARVWGWTPTISTWTALENEDGETEYHSNPWVPPDGNGGQPAITAPPVAFSGVMDEVESVDSYARAAADQVTQELARHQRRVFWLSTISTAAVAATAVIGIVKAAREAKHRRSGGS